MDQSHKIDPPPKKPVGFQLSFFHKLSAQNQLTLNPFDRICVLNNAPTSDTEFLTKS